MMMTALASPAPAAQPGIETAAAVAAADPVLIFEEGLLGFPDCRRFTLLPTERDGLFWLQSLDHESLVFLVADPFRFVPDYVVDLEPAALRGLEPVLPTDIAVLAIVTLARQPGEPCTVNLQGPIAINLRTQRARQIVLPDPEYGLRHPLDLA
ncbi:MAG TPA: flagellar assembly protein FliW [Longimicrobiales bacterium]